MDSSFAAESQIICGVDSGVGGCALDGLLDYVNGLPASDLAAVASIAWWRAMGVAKMGSRSRTEEMYIVSMCAARIAEEGLISPTPHF